MGPDSAHSSATEEEAHQVLPVRPEFERIRIGARLRTARQAHGWTIEQLAQLSNLTKGFLSRVERDATSPSVATLVNLCQVLSIDIGDLFERPRIELVAAEQAPRVNLGGQTTYGNLLTPRHELRLRMMRSTLDPASAGPEKLQSLASEIEVVHLISGRLELIFSSDVVALGAGDTLTFPGHEPHTWRNASSSESADVIWTLAVPAGRPV